MTQIPATVLHLLGEAVPETIPSPIGEISNIGIERVVFVILDNFGLFEIVVHQPEFMINNLESIILLETENPYAMAVMQQIVYGDLERRDFNLFEYLRSRNKSAVMIGREDDIKLFAGGTENIKSSGDMTTWIQASKILNKRDLIWLNFQDFEALYQRSIMFKREPPENLIQRLIHRTDKWLLGMFKQSRNNTVFIILGNHGRKKIDMNLTGKYAEWRKASLPIAIICRK
ncbi:MAG: hypothetical protein ACTSRP_24515 [Candidatus Helarchaeota archaeon]